MCTGGNQNFCGDQNPPPVESQKRSFENHKSFGYPLFLRVFLDSTGGGFLKSQKFWLPPVAFLSVFFANPGGTLFFKQF
jgi:hypothetical protein